MNSEKVADLHMHTIASDGTDTVKQRIYDAHKQELDAIAITDHDTINPGLSKRAFIAENGVEVITGAEIKSKINNVKIEILGYFLDPENKELQSIIEKNKNYRRERMKEMVKKVNEVSDANISFKEIENRSEGNVGRPHLAAEIVEKNLAKNENEAFKKYIGENCSSYVPTEKVGAGEVIAAIHESGGAAVLAHPGRDLNEENAERIVRKLIRLGLDGLEVEYTYRHKIQDGYRINFTEAYASEIAEKQGLVASGGSDCHGSKSNKYNIGKVKLPYIQVEKLRDKAEKHRN